MDKFSALPRYPFTHAMIEHAPELIYIGRATGALGGCTTKATEYTWELNLWPSARENELLGGFGKAHGREPRCQGKTVR